MATLHGMRVFIRVVEAGSFSAAGRLLGVAASSVSRQVAELEQSLNTRLFQRTTRKLSLTEAGDIYHQHALRIINDTDEARLALSQLDGTPTGTLRLSVPGSISRRYVIPAVVDFQRRYLGVEVMLLASDQVTDMVEQRIDLTLRLGALADSSLVARRIGSQPRFLCASPSYIKTAGLPLSVADLAQHNCLVFRSNPGISSWKFKVPAQVGNVRVRVSGNMCCNHGASLVAAAVEGHGIILVPGWLVSEELASGQLLHILPHSQPQPAQTPLYALYPQQQHLPAKVRAFIDFMVERESRS